MGECPDDRVYTVEKTTKLHRKHIKGAPFEELPRLESAPIIECLLYYQLSNCGMILTIVKKHQILQILFLKRVEEIRGKPLQLNRYGIDHGQDWL